MKSRYTFLAFALLASATAALAQGSLTPTGAPAPSMKTLDQLEPRTPLQAGAPGVAFDSTTGTYIIAAPGSYYLTGDIVLTAATYAAVSITAPNVTLDLGGFTISSSSSENTGSGITLLANASRVVIRNGFIRGQTTYANGIYSGGGFGYGISANYFSNTQVLVENVRVSNVSFHGLSLSIDSTTIRNCGATICGHNGLQASLIESSTADYCGGHGICGNVVTNCVGTCTAGSAGIYAQTAVASRGLSARGPGVNSYTVRDSSGTSDTGTGITARSVSSSYGTSTSGIGLQAYTVENSTGVSTAGSCGLRAICSAQNCYGRVATGGASTSSGLHAATAIACYGEIGAVVADPSTCYGLRADTAENCVGSSPSGYGLLAAFTATNCRGNSQAGTGLDACTANTCHGSNTTGTYGLRAYVALNSYGVSSAGIGLSAGRIATNCFGQTTSGPCGLYTNGTAQGCYGINSGGNAIITIIAVACTAGSGAISAPHKYLMP